MADYIPSIDDSEKIEDSLPTVDGSEPVKKKEEKSVQPLPLASGSSNAEIGGLEQLKPQATSKPSASISPIVKPEFEYKPTKPQDVRVTPTSTAKKEEEAVRPDPIRVAELTVQNATKVGDKIKELDERIQPYKTEFDWNNKVLEKLKTDIEAESDVLQRNKLIAEYNKRIDNVKRLTEEVKPLEDEYNRSAKIQAKLIAASNNILEIEKQKEIQNQKYLEAKFYQAGIPKEIGNMYNAFYNAAVPMVVRGIGETMNAFGDVYEGSDKLFANTPDEYKKIKPELQLEARIGDAFIDAAKEITLPTLKEFEGSIFEDPTNVGKWLNGMGSVFGSLAGVAIPTGVIGAFGKGAANAAQIATSFSMGVGEASNFLDSRDEQGNKIYNFNKQDEAAIKLGAGLVIGFLDKIGLDEMMGASNSKTIVKEFIDGISSMPKITSEGIFELAKKTLKDKIATIPSKALQIASEPVTETAQGLVTPAAIEGMNMLVSEDERGNVDWGKAVRGALEEGVLSLVPSVASSFGGSSNQSLFDRVESFRQNPELKNEFYLSLDKMVVGGVMKKEDAEEIKNKAETLMKISDTIPSDITDNKKRGAIADLLLEREELKKKLDGTPKALAIKDETRIKDIDKTIELIGNGASVEAATKAIERKNINEARTIKSKSIQESAVSFAQNTSSEISKINKVPQGQDAGAVFNLDGTKYSGVGIVVPVYSETVPAEEFNEQTVADFVARNAAKVSAQGDVKVGVYKNADGSVSIDVAAVVSEDKMSDALIIADALGQGSVFVLSENKVVNTTRSGKKPIVLRDDQVADAIDDISNGSIPSFIKVDEKNKGKVDERIAEAQKLTEDDIVDDSFELSDNTDIDTMYQNASESQKKVLATAKRITSSMKNTGAKVVVHKTRGSFVNALSEGTGTSKAAQMVNGRNRGVFLESTDKGDVIHLNVNATETTPLHEVSHAIVKSFLNGNVEAINAMYNELNAILAESLPEKEYNSLLRFRNEYLTESYTGRKEPNSIDIANANEEFIVEFLARISVDKNDPEYIDLNKYVGTGLIERIKDLLNRILEFIGIGGKDGVTLNTTDDVITFARKISKAYGKGQEIKFGVGEAVVNGNIVSGSTLKMQKTQFGDSKFEKVPAADSDEYKKRVNRGEISVQNPYKFLDGKVFSITFPDSLFVGSIDHNGKKLHDFFGGVFFVDDNFWASSNYDTAINFANQVNKSLEKNGNIGIAVLAAGNPLKHATSINAKVGFIKILLQAAEDNGVFNDVLSVLENHYDLHRRKTKDGVFKALDAMEKAGRIDYPLNMKETKESFNNLLKDLNSSANDAIAKIAINSGLSEDFFSKTPLKKGIYKAKLETIQELFIRFLTEDFLKGVETTGEEQAYAAIIIEKGMELYVDKEADLTHPSYQFPIRVRGGKPKLVIFDKTFTVSGKNNSIKRNVEKGNWGQASYTKAEWRIDKTKEGNPSERILSDKIGKYVSLADAVTPKFQLEGEVLVPAEYAVEMEHDDKGNYIFYHYGDLKGGKVDPKYFGKHKHTTDRRNNKISMYYTKGYEKEPMILGPINVIRVPKSKVYPFQEDPLGFYEKAREVFKSQYPDRAFDAPRQIDYMWPMIQEAGFDVVVAKWDRFPLRAEAIKALDIDKDATKQMRKEGKVDGVGRVGAKFQIVGENAQLEQDVRDNLQVAKDMELSGKSAKTIRLATGWEKGLDGKWRYEIQDAELSEQFANYSKAEIDDELLRNNNLKIGDILNKEAEIFKKYPWLLDVKIKGEKGGSATASYNYDSKTIVINTLNFFSNKALLSVILHELQHAIQYNEGFSLGGSPSNNLLRAIINYIDNEIELITKNPDGSYSVPFVKSGEKPSGKYYDLLKTREQVERGLNGDRASKYNAYNAYLALAGEVEARNVQRRMNMTPEERRKTTLKSTEDVKRKDQILSGKLKFQQPLAEVVNGFYSNTENALAQVKDEKMSGNKWKTQLLSRGGNKDEMTWTGLMGFLDENKDKSISKSDVDKFLKDNRIELKEVVLGKDDYRNLPEYIDADRKATDASIKIQEAQKKYWESNSDEDFDALQEAEKELEKWLDVKRNIERRREKQGVAKFSQYQLEGDKENYKEVLVTLPKKKTPPDSNVTIKSREELLSDKNNYTATEDNGYFVIRGLRGAKKSIKKDYFTPTKEKAIEQYIQDELSYQRGDTFDVFNNKGEYVETVLAPNKERAKEIYIGRNTVEEKTKFYSSHFDEPNILVHLRMNTRTDADGNKVLFIEEVQSDWGQKGKKEGFDDKELEKKRSALLDEMYALERQQNDNIITKKVANTGSISDYEVSYKNEKLKEDLDKKINSLRTEVDKINKQTGIIPTAPFVMDTNEWTKLGLKVAMMEAVKQGVDKIAWTTGEQQNDRYDLSKQVDKVSIANLDGGYEVEVVEKGKTFWSKVASDISAEKLADYVGKELAEKHINSGKDAAQYEGLDLKVGGKGMKGFYGSIEEGTKGIIGGVVEKLFGQKIGTTEINGNEQPSVEVTPQVTEQVTKGIPKFQLPKEDSFDARRSAFEEQATENLLNDRYWQSVARQNPEMYDAKSIDELRREVYDWINRDGLEKVTETLISRKNSPVSEDVMAAASALLAMQYIDEADRLQRLADSTGDSFAISESLRLFNLYDDIVRTESRLATRRGRANAALKLALYGVNTQAKAMNTMRKTIESNNKKSKKRNKKKAKKAAEDINKMMNDAIDNASENITNQNTPKENKPKKEENQRKSESEKVRKAKEKIKAVKEKWKGKNPFSGFTSGGLSPEAIEYSVEIAAAYIELGFYKAIDIADRIRKDVLKDFGIDIGVLGRNAIAKVVTENYKDELERLRKASIINKIGEKKSVESGISHAKEKLFEFYSETTDLTADEISEAIITDIEKEFETVLTDIEKERIRNNSRRNIIDSVQRKVKREDKINKANKALNKFYSETTGLSPDEIASAIIGDIESELDIILSDVEKERIRNNGRRKAIDEAKKRQTRDSKVNYAKEKLFEFYSENTTMKPMEIVEAISNDIQDELGIPVTEQDKRDLRKMYSGKYLTPKAISKLVKDEYSKKDATAKTIADKIAEEFGMSAEESTAMAEKLVEDITAEVKKNLERKYNLSLANAKKRASVTEEEKLSAEEEKAKEIKNLQEMYNAFRNNVSEDVMFEYFGQKFGLTEFNDADKSYIMKQFSYLKSLPNEGRGTLAEQQAYINIQNHISNMKPRSFWDMLDNLWYAATLSGPFTQLANIGYGVVSNISSAIDFVLLKFVSPFAEFGRKAPEGSSKLEQFGYKFALGFAAPVRNMKLKFKKNIWDAQMVVKKGPHSVLVDADSMNPKEYQGELPEMIGNSIMSKIYNILLNSKYVGRVMAAMDAIFTTNIANSWEPSFLEHKLRMENPNMSNKQIYGKVCDIMFLGEEKVLEISDNAAKLSRGMFPIEKSFDASGNPVYKVVPIDGGKPLFIGSSEEKAKQYLDSIEKSNIYYKRIYFELYNREMGRDVQKKAEDVARTYTLTREPIGNAGMVYKAIQNSLAWFERFGFAGRSIKFMLSKTVPFLRVPINFVDNSLDYTPFGFYRATSKSVREKREIDDMTRAIIMAKASRGILGMIFSLAFASTSNWDMIKAAFDDEDEEDDTEKRVAKRKLEKEAYLKLVKDAWEKNPSTKGKPFPSDFPIIQMPQEGDLSGTLAFLSVDMRKVLSDAGILKEHSQYKIINGKGQWVGLQNSDDWFYSDIIGCFANYGRLKEYIKSRGDEITALDYVNNTLVSVSKVILQASSLKGLNTTLQLLDPDKADYASFIQSTVFSPLGILNPAIVRQTYKLFDDTVKEKPKKWSDIEKDYTSFMMSFVPVYGDMNLPVKKNMWGQTIHSMPLESQSYISFGIASVNFTEKIDPVIAYAVSAGFDKKKEFVMPDMRDPVSGEIYQMTSQEMRDASAEAGDFVYNVLKSVVNGEELPNKYKELYQKVSDSGLLDVPFDFNSSKIPTAKEETKLIEDALSKNKYSPESGYKMDDAINKLFNLMYEYERKKYIEAKNPNMIKDKDYVKAVEVAAETGKSVQDVYEEMKSKK